MSGTERREYIGEIAIELLDGNPRKAEQVFGWGRETVKTGIAELTTGIKCLNNYSARGNKKTEEKMPELAGDIRSIDIKYLRWLKRYGFDFITMVRSNSIGCFTKNLKKSDMKLIHTKEKTKNKKTMIYGKLIESKVYGRVSHVLVSYNPDVEYTKNKNLDRRIEIVKQKVQSLNEKGGSLDKRYSEVNSLIAKKSLKRAIKVMKNEVGEKIMLEVNEEDLNNRRNKFGFFALFTHSDLTPTEIMKIYKSRDLV